MCPMAKRTPAIDNFLTSMGLTEDDMPVRKPPDHSSTSLIGQHQLQKLRMLKAFLDGHYDAVAVLLKEINGGEMHSEEAIKDFAAAEHIIGSLTERGDARLKHLKELASIYGLNKSQVELKGAAARIQILGEAFGDSE